MAKYGTLMDELPLAPLYLSLGACTALVTKDLSLEAREACLAKLLLPYYLFVLSEVQILFPSNSLAPILAAFL